MPTSHPVPINPPAAEPGVVSAALSDAFAHFNHAAFQLEESYRELQAEARELRGTLHERNEALKASLAENARMRTALQEIVNALPCGVVAVDENGRVFLINPEARRLLELKDGDVEELRQTPLARHVRLAPDGAGAGREDEFCLCTGPAKRWLAVRSRRFLLPCESSQETGLERRQRFVLIVRDTTGQKQMEETRENARNAVALAETAGVLAHEIRNPLASLELFAGLLEAEPENSAAYLSQLRAGIRCLSATVNNVLSVRNASRLPLHRLHLGKTLRAAVEFARPLADQKQIQLQLADELQAAEIEAEDSSLYQLVLNLALNAFRHTPAGGSLRIVATRETLAGNPTARIEFLDDGCGMTAAVHARIFEAGFSGNGQTPGLGLAVCRQIVESYGGSIRVNSQVGRGTSVQVELPLLS